MSRAKYGRLHDDTSPKIEKLILIDEFEDPKFLEFAIENYSEMFGDINIFDGKNNILKKVGTVSL